MAEVMFAQGTVVRMRHDPSCAGQITGPCRVKEGRTYWAVRMADGSGTHWKPEAQLITDTAEPDPIGDLAAGRFAPPESLRRLLLHHRLTGRLRDVIYSMDVTDTEFHAYQFKPVVKILASPPQGLLIADEVGLGKTIEAGLVWTELVARFDSHRLLVICPKSLTDKWRLELWQKFSVDARIVDARELLHHLEREGERQEGFALVASLSALSPNRGWEEDDSSPRARLMRFLEARSGQEPLIDCVIFDEAHHMRNADTMRHALARQMIELADYKLLLSATPINLRNEDLRNLLRLLDPETFESGFFFDQLVEENRPLVAARELALDPGTRFSDLLDAIRAIRPGQVLKIDRQLKKLMDDLAGGQVEDSKMVRNRIAAQLEEMSLLGSVVNRTRRRDVNDLQVKRRVHPFRWTMTTEEEAFYRAMSEIVREHAWTVNANELFLLATPQRLIASSLPAACRHWASRAQDLSLDDPDVDTKPVGSLVAKLAAACDDPDLLRQLESQDTKLARLIEALQQHWSEDPVEKIIIFSSFRVTLDYLAQRLAALGMRVHLMHGGVKEDRSEILARFQTQGGPAVLLTSEIGGEGLDMQFCRSLINYDLPWNPMKVEQRIGRIDRIGQQSPSITVLSMICAGTIEERVYDRLYARLINIQQTLGAFEPILGAEIAKLEQLLLDPKLTPDELNWELDRQAIALVERERQERELEEEAPGLIAHGDMILDRIEENHRPERQVSGAELADYVHEALSARFPGTRVEDVPGEPSLYEVQLSADAHLALKQILTRGSRARTRLNREARVRAVFERVPNLPKSVERITAVHPLARLAAKVRKEAAQAAAIRPVVCISAEPADGILPGSYVAAVQRWSVTGAVRVDRLAYAACRKNGEALDEREAEQLVQMALRTGRTCAGAAPPDAIIRGARRLIEDVLEPRFDRFRDEEEARHFDRAETGLARIEQQRQKRVRDIDWKLSEWKRSGDARKLRLIPAEEKKRDNLVAALNQRQAQLEAARDSFSWQDPELVGLAVILVGEEA
jgi:superfamily II DNA or RNA helicase